MRGFEEAGHDVLALDLTETWRACERDAANKPAIMSEASRQLAQILEQECIDATFGMWANGLTTFMHGTKDGEPATIFDLVGVPHVCYWLDAPHWAHAGAIQPYFKHPLLASRMLTHIINNEATAEEMRGVLGFGRTVAMPYGIDTESFRPATSAGVKFDVVASCGPGDPRPSEVAMAQLAEREPDYEEVRRDQAARLTVKLGNEMAKAAPLLESAMRALVERLVAWQLRDRHTPMLSRFAAIQQEDRTLALAAANVLADPRLYVALTMGVRRVEVMERAFTICLLASRFRVATFGKSELSAWGCSETNLGELPYEQMCGAYALGRVGLNAMRWQDDAGINLKPFEIAASGVACLSVARSGLDRAFEPGREIATFDLPAHAVTRVHEMLSAPGLCERLGASARERVCKEHRWVDRARAINACVERSATAIAA